MYKLVFWGFYSIEYKKVLKGCSFPACEPIVPPNALSIVCPSEKRRFYTHCHAICQRRLSALGVGTPSIGIAFDIFIGQHSLECPTSMIEIQHILDQEPGPRQAL
jgi:hypothetical protein